MKFIFGDVNGDGKITDNELKVADVNGDGKIDAQDGDLNKDGLVNKDDRGVDLRSDKSNNNVSGGGFDFKKFAEYFKKIIEIWVPQAAVKIPVPAPKTS